MTTFSPDTRQFTGSLVRPPWGYRQWMLAGNRALFFDRLVQDFGDFIHYRGLFNFYLINHPALVKQVLQETHEGFNKQTVIYRRFASAFGEGLVMAEGGAWRRQRALLQQVFGPLTIRRFFAPMTDAALAMVRRWEPWCAGPTVFDMAGEMDALTLEVVGRALFHDGFNTAAADIARWTHVINHYCGKPPLPIVREFWFPSRRNFRLKAALGDFHAFMQQMIDNRRMSGARDDLLSILLAARHEETGEAMTDREIREELLGMIIGGHETSSSALTWIWYELDRHPEVRQRLEAEIDAVVGPRPLEIDDLTQLVYTRMVIEETLRLHPPFWFENRNVTQQVELGGERLAPGSLVAFSRYSLHRHVDFWHEPERFDPERFAPGREENRRSTYACVPFGGGPRICIGMHFAMMELVVLLAILAGRYRVVVDHSDRHVMAANMTMTPKYGLRVRVEQRA